MVCKSDHENPWMSCSPGCDGKCGKSLSNTGSGEPQRWSVFKKISNLVTQSFYSLQSHLVPPQPCFPPSFPPFLFLFSFSLSIPSSLLLFLFPSFLSIRGHFLFLNKNSSVLLLIATVLLSLMTQSCLSRHCRGNVCETQQSFNSVGN